MYLAESCTADSSSLYRPNLLGGIVEYDVDLSNVSCGCVSHLYSVLMPAVDNTSDPFGYCDTDRYHQNGPLCPEFDFMQANKHAWYSAAHRCEDPDSNGLYSRCDHGGQCSINPKHYHLGQGRSYGPGSNYLINTQEPFHVKIDFRDINGQLDGYILTLSQGWEEVSMDTQNCHYMHRMSDNITQMAFVLSHWSGRNRDATNFMEEGQCQGSCQS